MRSGRTLAIAVAVALPGWSCGSTAPDATPKVASIVVSPVSSTLALNGQIPLQAQVQDSAGEIVAGAAVTWTVQDPRIVSISAEGVVTALAVGTSQVAANALGKSGVATITVSPAAVGQGGNGGGTGGGTGGGNGQGGNGQGANNQLTVTRVDVNPATLTLQAGQTQQLVAASKAANGSVVAGKTVTWSSDNGAVAAVNGGLVTTSKAGVATITASVGSVRGTATITVAPGPVATVVVSAPKKKVKARSTMQLAAAGLDNQGNTVPNQSFHWSSSNTNTATVSTSGVVTGIRKGAVTITAQTSGAGGKSGSVQVDVN